MKESTNPNDAFDENLRRTDTNILLPAGSNPGLIGSGTSILGGDVKTIFYVGVKEDFDLALEAARLEQEMMCGYPLAVKQVSRMTVDQLHEEVIATFGPPEAKGENSHG